MGVTGLKVRNNETGEEEVIETNGIFVAIGHTPNTKFLDGRLKRMKLDTCGEAGHIRNEHPRRIRMRRRARHKYRQAITAAGSGCMAALDCEKFLEGILYMTGAKRCKH